VSPSQYSANPDHDLLDQNRAVAAEQLSLETRGEQIRRLFSRAGWLA